MTLGRRRAVGPLVVLALATTGCAGAARETPAGLSAVTVPTASVPVAVASLAPTPRPASERITPAPTPEPSPIEIPPLTETLRSKMMGYSVRVPAHWTIYPAAAPWLPGETDFWDEQNGDRAESRFAGFRGGSQPLLPGQTADDWTRAYVGDQPADCGTREEVPLGGSVATFNLNGCRGLGRLGGRVYDIVVVVGGRAYNFTFEGEVDRGFVDAVLATLTIDPASAVDPP